MGGTEFHSEIDAYCRVTGAEIDPWEVGMLRTLYRLNMAANEKKSTTGPQPPTTDASDGAGVKGLMRGMGAKKQR